MSRFNVGDRVAVVMDDNIVEGKITKLYDELNVAIVTLDTEDVVKVNFSDMSTIREEKAETVKEPVEKSEITITPEEFSNIACKVIAENTDSLILGLEIANVMAKLHEALFVDEGEND